MARRLIRVRRRRREGVRVPYLACAALLVQALLCWGSISPWGLDLLRSKAQRQALNSPPVRAASMRAPKRPVYRYSVIRGGAYSPAELKSALSSDAVARAHYAV